MSATSMRSSIYFLRARFRRTVGIAPGFHADQVEEWYWDCVELLVIIREEDNWPSLRVWWGWYSALSGGFGVAC